MANTLTGLIPTLYAAVSVVSREMTGHIAAAFRNSSAESAALGQAINYPIVPAATVDNITPGVTAPNAGDATIGYGTMTISKSRGSYVRWNGEEEKSLVDNGMVAPIQRDRFAQAMRAIVREVEGDIGGLYPFASRAYGNAGTAPFGTAGDLSDIAQVRKILEDNGAPTSDLKLVLNSAAMANLRGKQSNLFKVNEAGTDDLLRRGVVGQLEGFDIHPAVITKTHTKGTAAGATTAASIHAQGATAISLASAGTGTLLPGDVVTFATENAGINYVLQAGDASTADGGSVTLNAPGLLFATAASARNITVGNNYSPNLAFSQSAIHVVTRAPAMPQGGDMADDVMNITDPISGLTFQVAVYRQYRQVVFEVGLAWGVKAVNSEHIAILMG